MIGAKKYKCMGKSGTKPAKGKKAAKPAKPAAKKPKMKY